MLPVLGVPNRTVCAVIDLYKQRICVPGVGIPRGLSVEDEERTMQLIFERPEWVPSTDEPGADEPRRSHRRRCANAAVN